MLITLCYVYLWVRFHKCYSLLIRHSLSRLTCTSNSFCLSFYSSSSSGSSSAPPSAPPTAPTTGPRAGVPRRPSPQLPGDNVFLQIGDRTVYVSEPQVLKWSDYCLPLACSPGQPFRAVALATLDNFSRLGVAFIEDRLQLDNGLVPSKIVPVLLQEHTLNNLLEKQCLQRPKTVSTPVPSSTQTEEDVSETLPHHLLADQHHLLCRKGSLHTIPEIKRVEERRGSEPLPSTDLGSGVNSEEHLLGSHHHMEGHGHNLHLSSCNECLELENSTIFSVKYASAENIPDLPDDSSVGQDGVDEGRCDANKLFGQSGGADCKSKPPNVLVYTGGSQERFQTIHQLLLECINVENIIIYPLQPQQALSDPWLDNTRLLILAEEESLTPELQTRFLTYLNQGGKVLGLGSTLCPAGVLLEVRERQRMQIRRLSFTKEDSTELELSTLAGGKVYLRDPQGGGEVELWGELKGGGAHQSDMVIIRVTHGGDGGEAVLCQVHFDIAPGSQSLDSECFDELMVSSALRYEILTEILNSLGLSCEPNQTEVPTPVHLLATSQEAKSSFLKWLQARADQNADLTFPKASFRLVSSSELHSGALLPEGHLALTTDSTESEDRPQFSIETYCNNLKTQHLGHTLLYSEVVTSTMDLLEGLTLHLPADVGLIAVAARQCQGRGRGGNAWLSPRGCAMFTLRVQVELSSRLGQRIPFLQHLAALAVVEAVCTLPGYQDIDLRVKWPNDIYYSDLMKLGGVLVTSTLLGSTFHLHIGCGFNVTNSNPTVCINDLILQHNRQHNGSLEPLSCSQLIARTLNCLEGLISSFQHGGPDAVRPTYYKRWLHSGTQVRLWSEEGPDAKVVGLDDNGFLQVQSEEQGIVSVEPDGNSFDMLKNLVVIKKR
ncbi:biotin--protein ligase isoform 2-T2 [Odontesthes bonariensis]|uniref:biotin--protein ligase isoform X2 n=1 Tax=Odontesthes bonariensis TaxID=219752 RepID=UPI003F5841DC